VVEYAKLGHLRNLGELFKGTKYVILFYPNFQRGLNTSGHYVALIKHRRGYEFYDPYGFKPDTKQKDTPQRAKLYQEDHNTLIGLFLKSGASIDYNHNKHQKLSDAVATCGRHAMFRSLCHAMNNDEYHLFVTKLSKQYRVTPDVFVSMVFS